MESGAVIHALGGDDVVRGRDAGPGELGVHGVGEGRLGAVLLVELQLHASEQVSNLVWLEFGAAYGEGEALVFVLPDVDFGDEDVVFEACVVLVDVVVV